MNKGFLFILVAVFIAGLIIIGMSLIIFGDNVKNIKGGFHTLYIPSDANYEQTKDLLVNGNIIRNPRSFEWVADKMNYRNTVEAGKYIIPSNISNRGLIRQLRNGYQEQPVRLSINSIDTKNELYSVVSNILESDSLGLAEIFENDSFLSTRQLNIDNGWSIVLADTYNFNWDTEPKIFFNRMQKEFDHYWTDNRVYKARANGLSPIDCIILASIIEKESTKQDEYPRIAGVYINRLKGDWPLQADPTIKFALNQPGLKRILTEHLEIDSPYNTYKYKGLPPGPISLPEKTTLESILNAEEHSYMYFCASADFSGYHLFAKTLREHRKNARKYQQALNENEIY